jgi:hypothetical protein
MLGSVSCFRLPRTDFITNYMKYFYRFCSREGFRLKGLKGSPDVKDVQFWRMQPSEGGDLRHDVRRNPQWKHA